MGCLLIFETAVAKGLCQLLYVVWLLLLHLCSRNNIYEYQRNMTESKQEFSILRSEPRAVSYSDKLFRHSPHLIVGSLVQSQPPVALLGELGCEELYFGQTFLGSIQSSPSPVPFPHVPEMPITVLPRKYGYRSSPDSSSSSSFPILHLLISSPSPTLTSLKMRMPLGETRCAVMSWQCMGSVLSA